MKDLLILFSFLISATIFLVAFQFGIGWILFKIDQLRDNLNNRKLK